MRSAVQAVSLALSIVLSTVLWAVPARADDAVSTAADDADPDGATVALALGATLIPGVVVRGSGHYVLGRKRAAARLLMLEGIGIGMMFLGITPLVVTNASRYVARSAAALVALGAGPFVVSSIGDLYGVAVPLDRRGEPLTELPSVQAELGYRFVISPALPQTHLALTRLDLRWHGLHVQPTLWHAVDAPAARQRLQLGFRGYGPTAGAGPARDGSFLQLNVAFTRHTLHGDGVTSYTTEVFTHGRLDLARIDRDLRGMFGLGAIGVGLQTFDYDGIDAIDRESLLLVRSGFGAYLGAPGRPNGEVAIYYDQRHDDFAGGLNDRAVGIPGHVGVSAHGYLAPWLGLRGIVEVGANVVGGVSWLVREP